MSQSAHIVDKHENIHEGIANADAREPLYDFLTDNGVNIVKTCNTEGCENDYCEWEIDRSELNQFIGDLEATIIPYPEYMYECYGFDEPEKLIAWLKELAASTPDRTCVFVQWF